MGGAQRLSVSFNEAARKTKHDEEQEKCTIERVECAQNLHSVALPLAQCGAVAAPTCGSRGGSASALEFSADI